MRQLLISTLFFVFAHVAFAGTFENDDLSLDIPVGFQGPFSQPFGSEATTVAYTKLHLCGQQGTLLQITTYDFGSTMPVLSKEQLGEVADKYLGQFLKGVERRRQSFSALPPARVTLGGIPASRVSWKGLAEGQAMSGVMYCVVVGKRVISFHTQDIDTAPPENLKQAVRAFEAVRFKHGG